MSARSSMTSRGRSCLPKERPTREEHAANQKLVFEHFQFSGGALPFSYCHFPERRSTGLPNSKLAVTFLKKSFSCFQPRVGHNGQDKDSSPTRFKVQAGLLVSPCQEPVPNNVQKSICLLLTKDIR